MVVIVSGALANKPYNGGNAWSRLSWVDGFRRLGFEVYFVEQIDKNACHDLRRQPCEFEASVNLGYFRQIMHDFEMEQSCSLICQNGDQTYGLSLTQLKSLAEKACLLLNVSGHLTLPEIRGKLACQVYYDDDPGFTQFWHAENDPGARLWDHDFFFTIGENIGRPECEIPTMDVQWRHTRPPVVIDQWPVHQQSSVDRFTTIASWRGPYGPIQHNGKTYGLKVHEFRKLMKLPQWSRNTFEVALQIDPADNKDLEALVANGWQISDPKAVAGSPQDFRGFVQRSGAEFSVAQGVYVDTQSGWFSDRTVRYLASGKPALVQDTGFSRNYPTGQGLLPFRTLGEAIEGSERIARDYQKHCQAARRIAEEYFDAGKVIRAMAQEIGLPLP